MKRRIREKILSRRNKEPEDLRRKKSRRIKERLFSLLEFKEAHTILFYLAKDSEVETREAVEEALLKEKRVVLPMVKGKELLLGEIKDLRQEVEMGGFGILEPKEVSFKEVSPQEIDLVILPGIAFDLKGGRIGYGKGYYDRFLGKLPREIPLVGLAYHFQIVAHLPIKEHDRKVFKVITERGVLERRN